MSHTADLVRGLLVLLDEQGVGRYRPKDNPGPVWADDDVALAAVSLPVAPDRAVALHPYPVSSDARLSESIEGLQFTFRGHREWDDVEDIAGQAFDVLQGLRNHRLTTGVWVELLTFQSGAPGGVDGNSRRELTHNYYARTHRPSQHRT